MTNARTMILWLAILSVVSVGCNDGGAGNKRVPVFTVSGKVTMNGGPLTGAMISFVPTEGQPVAVGRSNDAGEYSLTTYDSNDGAAKGAYKITVMKVVAPSTATADASHGENYKGSASHGGKAAKGTADSGNLVPPQFGDSVKTPLTFTVEEKANTHDIEVK